MSAGWGLVYFDGDADLDRPGTGWGILDSMGVAHIIGEGDPRLSHLGPRYPLVEDDRLVLFGYHPSQLSPAQISLLNQRSLNAFPVTEFAGSHRSAARAALAHVEARADAILVHFDIDAVDSGDFPLADCPRFNGGLTLEEALDCLSIFVSSPKVAGLTLTEINPDHDPEGELIARLVPALAESLASIGAADLSQQGRHL